MRLSGYKFTAWCYVAAAPFCSVPIYTYIIRVSTTLYRFCRNTMGNNIFFPAFLYYFFLFFFLVYFFFPSTVCPQRIRRWCAFSVFFFSSAVTLLLLRRPRTTTPESRPAHRYISLFLLVVNPSLIEFDVRKSS